MTILLVIAIGTLVGLGAWLLLDPDLIRATVGALLVGHGAVLLLVAPRAPGAAPLLGPGGAIPDGIADALPQALALTAIVISFAVATLLLAATGVPGDDHDGVVDAGVVDAGVVDDGVVRDGVVGPVDAPIGPDDPTGSDRVFSGMGGR